MTTVIKKGEVMREEMNRVVDHELQRHQEPTKWEKVLDRILNRFVNEPDYYEIVIQGRGNVSNEPQDEPKFVNEMRLTMGQLRAMKRP